MKKIITLLTGTEEDPPKKKLSPMTRDTDGICFEEPTTEFDDIKWYAEKTAKHAKSVLQSAGTEFAKGMDAMAEGTAEVMTVPAKRVQELCRQHRRATLGIAGAAMLATGALYYDRIGPTIDAGKKIMIRGEALRYIGNDANGPKVDPIFAWSREEILGVKADRETPVRFYIQLLNKMPVSELEAELTTLKNIKKKEDHYASNQAIDPGLAKSSGQTRDGAERCEYYVENLLAQLRRKDVSAKSSTNVAQKR